MTTMSDDEAFSGEHFTIPDLWGHVCSLVFLTSTLFPGPHFMPKVAAPTQSYSLSVLINEN